MPYIEMKLDQIIFDPNVQTYCINPNFKCPNYGHSWACPPEAPYLEERISKFRRFFLIYYKLDLNEYITKIKTKNPKRSKKRIITSLYAKNILRDNLEKEIFDFLEKFRNTYNEKLVLWDGFCRICNNSQDKGCTYDSGEPCRYPNKIRYSMEAVGIDVDKTVKNLNMELEWPPIRYAYRFGLISLK